jgi:hypothetical protein
MLIQINCNIPASADEIELIVINDILSRNIPRLFSQRSCAAVIFFTPSISRHDVVTHLYSNPNPNETELIVAEIKSIEVLTLDVVKKHLGSKVKIAGVYYMGNHEDTGFAEDLLRKLPAA